MGYQSSSSGISVDVDRVGLLERIQEAVLLLALVGSKVARRDRTRLKLERPVVETAHLMLGRQMMLVAKLRTTRWRMLSHPAYIR